MESGQRLREPNQRLELAHGDAIRRAAASHGISLPKLAVAVDQDASALLGDLGIQRPRESDVSQHLILRERRLDHGLVASVDIYYVLRDVVIRHVVAFVQHNEE